MEKNKKYLNFPLIMLQGLHVNSNSFLNNVFDVGIYFYSKTLTGSEEKCYKDALGFLGIKQVTIKDKISNAKNILRLMPDKYPIVGIEKDMLFDFYKNTKDDYDWICLSAFLGIKSILGKKPYDKTNKAMIHARMFGYVTPRHLPTELTPLQAKYKIRWHMDKLLLELETNWHLKVLSNHNRGFYVSFDLSYDEMALIIEKNKQSTKKQQLIAIKKKAIENAKLSIQSSLAAS